MTKKETTVQETKPHYDEYSQADHNEDREHGHTDQESGLNDLHSQHE